MIDLAILQLQENNRLEILKRKWWEGGKCPKEEDHRAKGKGVQGLPSCLEDQSCSCGVQIPSNARLRTSLGRS